MCIACNCGTKTNIILSGEIVGRVCICFPPKIPKEEKVGFFLRLEDEVELTKGLLVRAWEIHEEQCQGDGIYCLCFQTRL